MSDSYAGLLKQPFILLLVLLAAIGGSLFLILSFVSSAQISEGIGAALFVVVAGLVFAGYVVGVMVLAFVVILVLTRYWQRTERK
jgi:membrane protein implicated in regulation of membrane protease activity